MQTSAYERYNDTHLHMVDMQTLHNSERMCVFNIFCVCVCVCFQVVCDMIVCVCVYDVMKPSTGPDLPQKHITLGAPRTLHMCKTSMER